jgi:RAQPRD family integrative conjugative element protein
VINIKGFVLGGFLLIVSISALADQERMNETLVRMINQLDAMTPLIEHAKREQPQGTRFQFHFEQFEGSDGQYHNGLKEDVMAIRQALVEQINQPEVDPYHIKPLNTDFVGENA